MSKVLMVVVVVLLSGCAEFNEGMARAKAQKESERMQKVSDVCVRYGFKHGTPEFSNCMMQTDMEMTKAAAEERRRRIAAIEDDDRQQQQIRQDQFQQSLIKPSKMPAQTNCQTLGNQTNCTTWR